MIKQIKQLLFASCLVALWLVGSGIPLGMAQQLATTQRVDVNVLQLRQQLAPVAGASTRSGFLGATYRVSLPTLRGIRPFVLTESFVLPAADTAAQRRLRTFVGYEEGAPTHQASVVLTPHELTADLLAGPESVSLEPASCGELVFRPSRLLIALVRSCGACATLCS